VSAVTMCERLDIKSCKDTEKLKKAKDEVYLKGFYEGVMLVGECTGMKVCDAKPIIRKVLLDKGDALIYFEPESLVMSRTGDEVRLIGLSTLGRLLCIYLLFNFESNLCDPSS
jgi:leucyl-tRNA synthetase